MSDDKPTIESTGSGYYVNGEELEVRDVKRIDEDIDRVRTAIQLGRPDDHASTPPDRKTLADYQAGIVKGRDADKDGYWRQVMEYHGFTWMEPEQLTAMLGPMAYVPPTLDAFGDERIHDAIGRAIQNSNLYWTKPHEEGQWRNDAPNANRRPGPWFLTKRLGFTMKDLVTMYLEPRAFDEWARLIERRWRRSRDAQVAQLQGDIVIARRG